MASRLRISEAQLDEWKRLLDQRERVSKRKGKAVEMRRLVLAALEANSDAEYRSINERLRAKLAGHVRTKHYREIAASTPVEERGTERRKASGPAIEECTTEEEGVTYTDECLTEQERADNAVWAAALYAETVADYDEGYDDCYATASDPSTECEWAASPSPAPSALMSPSLEGAPFLAESDTEPGSCVPAEPFAINTPVSRTDCLQKAVAAGIAVVTFGSSTTTFLGKYGNVAWSAARGAGNAGRAGLIGGAFATGWAIGTWINCRMGWEMLEAQDFVSEVRREAVYSYIL